MKLLTVLSTVLLTSLTANAWHFGVGLNPRAACSCPMNCFSKVDDACKFWSDTGHVTDGNCQLRSGIHLLSPLECKSNGTVTLIERALRMRIQMEEEDYYGEMCGHRQARNIIDNHRYGKVDSSGESNPIRVNRVSIAVLGILPVPTQSEGVHHLNVNSKSDRSCDLYAIHLTS
ncbi:hypothetical protein D9757_002441 [Collybiopsis confluens]|uniref:Uncharacterized protein n=1 Tax=Collybiopsis confluens TaxID=2823264 RepID=A0A8H5HY49_9AGAR|nr:hypothetical protein D9757_002441 [Collybiopsis confluens]